jgi:hypothetical protein
MPKSTSPASAARARRVDQALDDERARVGNDRNRDRADRQVPPSHGDKSLRLPGTHNGRVAR